MAISDPSHLINQMVNLWYVDIINNNLIVELIDLNDNQIQLFKHEIFDSPAIQFTESRGLGRTLG